MRKKFFAMYALVGALVASPVFTSCVDDSESASVTAIRNAKAEQLKAAAALAQAQAQAETTLANAEAALKAAQAAHEQALANATEAEQARLEQVFALKLDSLKNATELEIMELQSQIAVKKDEMANADINRFNVMYNKYSQELSALILLNTQLTSAKNTLAGYEAGDKAAEIQAQLDIKAQEKIIATNKALLTLLKDPAYVAMDQTEVYAKYQVALKECELAEKTFNNTDPSIKALVEAGAMLKEKALAADKISDAVKALDNFYGNVIDYNQGQEWTNFYYYSAAAYDDFSFGDAGEIITVTDVEMKEADILAAKRYYAGEVDTYAKILGKETDTKDTETEEGSGTLTAYAALAAANAQMAEAEALTDAAAKATAIATAEEAIADAKDALTTALNDYNTAVENQTKFNELLAAVGSAEAANKAIEELKDAAESQEKARLAWVEACANGSVAEKEAAKDALLKLYNQNSADLATEILNAELAIANAEKQIEILKANDTEALIAGQKETIANLEYQISVKEVVVEQLKAQLDALLAEYDTEEDTEVEEDTEAEA